MLVLIKVCILIIKIGLMSRLSFTCLGRMFPSIARHKPQSHSPPMGNVIEVFGKYVHPWLLATLVIIAVFHVHVTGITIF